MQSKNILLVAVLATVLLTAATISSTYSFAVKPDTTGKAKQVKAPKQVQNVKIIALVDTSDVSNATAAAQAYTFTVQSGSFLSKAKSIDSNITDGENIQLVFAGKLAVSTGDGFSITGISSNDQYQTVVGTGTFKEIPLGKSGKSSISGELSEPLVLQESSVEGLQ